MTMSDLDSSHLSGTHLLALTLARALDLELSNTTEICLSGRISIHILTSELAQVGILIDGIQRQVSILRSHLRPINRLPPELVAYIFSFLGGGRRVVSASLVCQKWRQVALNTPALWTVFREDEQYEATYEFLERSQNMPLDFTFNIFMRYNGTNKKFNIGCNLPYYDFDESGPGGHRSIASFTEFSDEHGARMRRLHMHVYGDRAYDFYALLARYNHKLVLPALEHLSIRVTEYRDGFRDDTRGRRLRREPFFSSQVLTKLTFRGAVPLETHLSPSIRSLNLAERSFDLDALLACLSAAPNLEYLALLNSVPHTFECAARTPVSLPLLRELHWFQVWVFDNLFGTVKFFEHLDAPNLQTTCFVLLLDPTKYAATDLYLPCHRAIAPFGPITELHLEAAHFTPGKPARNNLVFHGGRAGETLFSVRVNRGSLDALCTAGFATAPDPPPSDEPDASPGLALASSLLVDVDHLTQLTLSSAYPYDWSRFFRHPDAWPRFLRAIPAVKILRLRITQPIQIIAAIAAADERVAPSRLLPNLRILHLFRPRPPTQTTTTTETSPTVRSNNSIYEGDNGQILVRFLQRRADLGIPIQSIVCSAEDAIALPPEALALVDSVKVGNSETWGTEPLFPKSIISLLEEHLD